MSHNMGTFKTPEMDWTPDPGLQARFKDWEAVVKLQLKGPLCKESKESQCAHILLWAGKPAIDYINARPLDDEDKDKPDKLLEHLQEWTKPQSNQLAAAAELKVLHQGDMHLSQLVNKVTELVKACQYPEDPAECQKRLIRDALVLAVSSTSVYSKCLEKGNALTLEEVIKICQAEELTQRQVELMKAKGVTVGLTQPEPPSSEASEVHRIYRKKPSRKNQKHTSSEKRSSSTSDDEDICERCGNTHKETDCPAYGVECNYCHKVGHYKKMCRKRLANEKMKRRQKSTSVHELYSGFQCKDIGSVETYPDSEEDETPVYTSLVFQ